ncbi:immunity protein Imm33 domain-containing protein [Acinetobacter bouvetii]|uniref:Imm33-like domain-containing protein n=1 Tax=Acinetobacter bouvetii TaxID=202951 RepID=A0A811GFX7_9GAMM|nr:hypothetical protein [Acinetobacter bouvetii]CAB1221448.1 hypothetical protein SFB21_2794 [Acinetobacter bouvetii]
MPKHTQQLSPLEELIAEQKLLCEEFESAYIQVSGDDVVAVAVQTLNKEPIVGIRKKPETEENVAWFIYGGELEAGEDFFQTMTVRELQDILPEVLPYLALAEGFRFMIDRDDYEDVWKED